MAHGGKTAYVHTTGLTTGYGREHPQLRPSQRVCVCKKTDIGFAVKHGVGRVAVYSHTYVARLAADRLLRQAHTGINTDSEQHCGHGKHHSLYIHKTKKMLKVFCLQR